MATNFPYPSFQTSSKTKGLETSNRFTVIPRQTKHSWPRNLKYNREHIGANPRWHVTDLKASKHDPKAFPSTVLSFLSNQPTKVFRSKSSLSLCAFHNGSFVPGRKRSTPLLPSLESSIRSRHEFSRSSEQREKRVERGGRRGNAEVAMRQANERGSGGQLSRPNPYTNI